MTNLTEKQKALLDELLKDFDGDAESLLGKNGLMMQLKKRAVEAMLEGEITDHLGYEPSDPAGNGSGNFRNGRTGKTVQSKNGPFEISVPRDRNSSFDPRIIRKGQRRMDGIDDVIISFYARGLSTREIQAKLNQLYGANADLQRHQHGFRRG